MVYPNPVSSFATNVEPKDIRIISLMEDGPSALESVNTEMGLAFDDWDLKYYYSLFVHDLKRNPTDVELFDIAQSNSEHSRHWFFKAELKVDGIVKDECLFDIVRDTLDTNKSPLINDNSVIGFKDNSSAIRGRKAFTLLPSSVGEASEIRPMMKDLDLLFTAETHNFPCAVAPYPGAETGAGGRIRDTHATGRGSIVVASTAGYCVGNLKLPSTCDVQADVLASQTQDFAYPTTLAPPLQILLDASDGASDYGNKFGEPLIAGYMRSFGLRLHDGTRREWLKPIMFSAGLGQIFHEHVEKLSCEVGMEIVKIGGPAYRIGLGGGAASSLASGSNDAELDFNAVQRGDAQMAHKLNRVVRACIELGDENPIVSIHDQGAGGNCNVVKEIAYPEGARINVRAINVGDSSLSVLEIWGAEYQENDCMLVRKSSLSLLRSFCARERLPMAVIGSITGDGKIVLVDDRNDSRVDQKQQQPEDIDLEKILGELPRKKFSLNREVVDGHALVLPTGAEGSVITALQRVLRLPAVCSKRFLTSKVDRSVTGLVARQQCIGPLLLPLADHAIIAQSHYVTSGGVTSIGEQPLKGLLNPAAMARLATAEAITNMFFAKVTSLHDVKCSVNWMYAAKMRGEGAAMYDAAKALRETFHTLGIAVDGGKDSLSMAASVEDKENGTQNSETVMSPGNLVVSAYVTSPDITKSVTPDLKMGDSNNGCLLYINFSGRKRLGGSALSHAYGQLGDVSPDLDTAEIESLKRAFHVTQQLLDTPSSSSDSNGNMVITAGHDISDGGLVTCILEMAFAGNCGVKVNLQGVEEDDSSGDSNMNMMHVRTLFAEEPGVVFEVSQEDSLQVIKAYEKANVECVTIGYTTRDKTIQISIDDMEVINEDTAALRSVWEETAFDLERLQCTPECVVEEEHGILSRKGPFWNVDFEIKPILSQLRRTSEEVSLDSHDLRGENENTENDKHRVCVLREEGSNGDREMAAALEMAGLEPWDVTMSDLINGVVSLDDFRALVFVGGFSFADVLDSAKGWAGTILLAEPSLRRQFENFRDRENTVSLGVCNGCQLMALLGWVTPLNKSSNASSMDSSSIDPNRPRFVQNTSGRFESRFVQVKIDPTTPSVLLRGMRGSTLGVWCAHGEGRAVFPSSSMLESVKRSTTSSSSQQSSLPSQPGLVPLRYVDDAGNETESYPMNPNGSVNGIAALCSADGRHTAMMPHPERSFLKWQLPYVPKSVAVKMNDAAIQYPSTRRGEDALTPSPWINMFHEMREWLTENE